MRVLALLLTAGAIVACTDHASIEGTWRYDRDRLGELSAVVESDPESAGSFDGAFADDSERGKLLRALELEAQETTVVITKQAITIERKHDDDVTMPYRLVKRAGNDWLLIVTEGSEEHPLTVTLAGARMRITDARDRVRYVLIRN